MGINVLVNAALNIRVSSAMELVKIYKILFQLKMWINILVNAALNLRVSSAMELVKIYKMKDVCLLIASWSTNSHYSVGLLL